MGSLVAERLSKELGGRLVLRDVSLAMTGGRCLALLGANGSGKSTLLRVLSTLWRPTSGRVLWNDEDARKVGASFRTSIGYVGHEPLVYGDWSGRANLEFLGRLYGVENLHARIDELLDEVRLSRFARDPVYVYSRGMVQRLALARAFLHRPDILLLDEPFSGLDTALQRHMVDRLQQERAAGRTIVLVTHALELGHELATDIAFLRRGEAEMAGAPSLEALRADYDAIVNA